MITISSRRAGDLPYTGNGYSVYVGRPSTLGNPFPASDESKRTEVVEKYRVWLRNEYTKKQGVYSELQILAHMHKEGIDINLECWCYPRLCHANVIRDAIKGIAATLE